MGGLVERLEARTYQIRKTSADHHTRVGLVVRLEDCDTNWSVGRPAGRTASSVSQVCVNAEATRRDRTLPSAGNDSLVLPDTTHVDQGNFYGQVSSAG
jgi:hypothetical protein